MVLVGAFEDERLPSESRDLLLSSLDDEEDDFECFFLKRDEIPIRELLERSRRWEGRRREEEECSWRSDRLSLKLFSGIQGG